MLRVVTAFAVAWFVLVQPVTARAARASAPAPDAAGMCEDGSQAVRASGLDGLNAASYAGAGLMDVSVSTEDSDASAASSVPSATASVSAGVSAKSDKSEDGLAWCISPDDPRCAPRDAGSPLFTHRLSPLAQAAAHFVGAAPAESAWVIPAAPMRQGHALAGVQRSLERPPRA